MAAENFSFNLEQLGINLPYSMDAEQAVLGAAILSADSVPAIMEKLRPEYFYSRRNAEIFSEIVSLFSVGVSIDIVTLLNATIKNGIFENEQEARGYLATLAETVPSISNVGNYADIVYEKYLTRMLMAAAGDILDSAQTGEEAQLLLEKAEQRIYEIRAGKDSSSMQTLKSAIFDTFSRLQKITGPDKEKYLGIPTGFTYLDSMLTGLGRSDLIILAARPGMGKTSLALNIATNVAEQSKVPVAIFSLEMTKEQLASRILASKALIDSKSMRTGNLSRQDWVDLAQESDGLSATPIYLDDTSGITINEMKAKVRRLNQDPAKPNIGLIIIDYLQLMSSGRRTENRVQEISEMTRNLKNMAKELDVPVITLSQLSRAPDKATGGSRRPVLSDLRDSGSIEQDADVVLFLYRESYYNQDGDVDEGVAECIVSKNRHGDTGKIKLGWDAAHTKFSNIEWVQTDDDDF